MPGRPDRARTAAGQSLLRSGLTAARGAIHALRSERNLRIQAVLGAAAVVLGLLIGLSPVEWACLVLAVGLVLVAEVVNTALEAVVDPVTAEFHPLARIAKDVAAGAALVAALTAVGVGIAVFGPRLLADLPTT